MSDNYKENIGSQFNDLQRVNKYMSLLIDNTDCFYMLLDENTNVLFCNDNIKDFLGILDINEIVGKPIMKVFEIIKDEAYFKRCERRYKRLLAGEDSFTEDDVINLPKKGKCVFRILHKLIHNEGDSFRGIVLIFRELSLEHIKISQGISEAKSQFLASMSHEIRTPMNTLINLLELMRTDNLDTEQLEYIKDLKRMSAILLQIINDILDFHEIESGKLEFSPIHFNLYELYDDLVSQYKSIAESRDLIFKSSFAVDLPHVVFGDNLRINQVITNLLSNAIKYTREGYVNFSVDSTVENDEKFIVFTVEDTGIGIKEENFPNMFKKLEQFDINKNRGVTGTGLGLAIAKCLADMMNGHIQFNSQYKKGSVFIFYLPLEKGDIEKIEQSREVERVYATPDTKVLVVDDNDGNIIVAVGLLGRHGINPQIANNGKQAIEMIKNDRYDLVFMDHMMPEMDGVEATIIIRELDEEYYRKLPIIALSANVVASAIELFAKSGMNDFLSKPINSNELNRVLFRWLPEERIMGKKLEIEALESSTHDSISHKLLEELMKIVDLNVAEGLTHVGGNKKLYADLLWQFCNSAGADVKDLRTFMKDGEWKDYSIKVHAIKTVFANMGNQFMSDWAFSLEKAVMRGDINKCINETDNFCGALIQFFTKLKNTELMNSMKISADKTIISSQDLRKKLKQLLSACDDFNAEEAEPVVKELLSVTIAPNIDALLEPLSNFVLSFDYDKAAELIEEIMELIKQISSDKRVVL